MTLKLHSCIPFHLSPYDLRSNLLSQNKPPIFRPRTCSTKAPTPTKGRPVPAVGHREMLLNIKTEQATHNKHWLLRFFRLLPWRVHFFFLAPEEHGGGATKHITLSATLSLKGGGSRKIDIPAQLPAKHPRYPCAKA